MDEVIICTCGYDQWAIGTNGIRCGRCARSLPREFVEVQVVKANEYLRGIEAKGGE